MTEPPQPPHDPQGEGRRSGGGEGRLVAGRYRLEGVLGRGGMATVHAGTDIVLDRPVAVKILDLGLAGDPLLEERFRREARATAALNDPGIVTVYDAGVTDDTAFIVMERLPGRTVADTLREQGPLPVPQARSIAAQVAQALSVAHAAGIVHRDIKPGNIAYTSDSGTTVKVVDFGITQLLDRSQEHQPLTRTDTVIGTAEYLSPEQGVGEAVDERADLYALGCVIYAMLTGQPPFTGPTAVVVLLAHQQQHARDVRELRPDVPADLAALVDRLLAKDPRDRPASAAQVAEALRHPSSAAATEVLTHSPPRTSVLPPVSRAEPSPGPSGATSGPPPPPPRLETERSRSWVPALILAVLVVIGGVWWIQMREAPSQGQQGTPGVSGSATPTGQTPVDRPTSAAPTTPTPSASGTPQPSITSSPGEPGPDLTNEVRAMHTSLVDAGQVGVLEPQQVRAGTTALEDLNRANLKGDGDAVERALGEIQAVVGSAQPHGSEKDPRQEAAIRALQTAYVDLAAAARGSAARG